MAKCPNCGWENAESKNYCENCMEDMRYDADGAKEVLLVTVFSEEEALVLEGLLKSEGIYFYRRNDRVGDFLKGTTGSGEIGLSIFVSEKDYDLAHELINSEPVPFDDIFSQHEENKKDIGEEKEDVLLRETGEGTSSLLITVLLIVFVIYLLIR